MSDFLNDNWNMCIMCFHSNENITRSAFDFFVGVMLTRSALAGEVGSFTNFSSRLYKFLKVNTCNKTLVFINFRLNVCSLQFVLTLLKIHVPTITFSLANVFFWGVKYFKTVFIFYFLFYLIVKY